MRPLSLIAHQATRAVAKKRGGFMAALQLDWAQAAGAEVAAVTQPKSLRAGVLTIAVDSAHALALQHAEPALIDRLNAFFGGASVKRVAWRQTRIAPPARPSAAAAAPMRAPVAPPDLAAVEDDELKAALAGFHEAITRA